MENFDHIHIFKTNINTDVDLANIRQLLDDDAAITTWSVDTEDEDRVLRVVTHLMDTYQIINLINSAGYLCCELI